MSSAHTINASEEFQRDLKSIMDTASKLKTCPFLLPLIFSDEPGILEIQHARQYVRLRFKQPTITDGCIELDTRFWRCEIPQEDDTEDEAAERMDYLMQLDPQDIASICEDIFSPIYDGFPGSDKLLPFATYLLANRIANIWERKPIHLFSDMNTKIMVLELSETSDYRSRSPLEIVPIQITAHPKTIDMLKVTVRSRIEKEGLDWWAKFDSDDASFCCETVEPGTERHALEADSQREKVKGDTVWRRTWVPGTDSSNGIGSYPKRRKVATDNSLVEDVNMGNSSSAQGGTEDDAEMTGI